MICYQLNLYALASIVNKFIEFKHMHSNKYWRSFRLIAVGCCCQSHVYTRLCISNAESCVLRMRRKIPMAFWWQLWIAVTATAVTAMAAAAVVSIWATLTSIYSWTLFEFMLQGLKLNTRCLIKWLKLQTPILSGWQHVTIWVWGVRDNTVFCCTITTTASTKNQIHKLNGHSGKKWR